MKNRDKRLSDIVEITNAILNHLVIEYTIIYKRYSILDWAATVQAFRALVLSTTILVRRTYSLVYLTFRPVTSIDWFLSHSTSVILDTLKLLETED